MKSTTIAAAAFLLAILTTEIAAQTIAPARVRNIENAGTAVGAIQKASGSDGAFAAINECYKREAAALTPRLEACMAQDIIVSQATAAFYSRLPAGGQRSDAVLKAMTDRVVGTMARFKVPQDDARAFAEVAKTRGMEAYSRAMFGSTSGSKN